MLKGYKTYIVGFLLVVLAGLKALGHINEDVYQALLAALTGGGLMALRAAVAGK